LCSCPFCVAAHGTAVQAAGARDDALSAWAASIRSTTSAADPKPAPFEEHKEEYLGTAVAFHYLNRVVSVFLDDSMSPLPRAFDCAVKPMSKMIMGGVMKKSETLVPGDSLDLLPSHNPDLAWEPCWAQGSSSISRALASWSAIVEATAQDRVPAAVLESVGAAIETWQWTPGAPPPTRDEELMGTPLPADLVAAGRLAALTALVPSSVTEELVLEVVNGKAALGTAGTLALVAWAGARAAKHHVNCAAP
jgi:hypothetical protein